MHSAKYAVKRFLSVCPLVYLFVTFQYGVKTAKHVQILPPSGSSVTEVFSQLNVPTRSSLVWPFTLSKRLNKSSVVV